MADEGIVVWGITPQNEPLYGGNNPSMVMNATEEALFISKYLGPALAAAGGTVSQTKILIYDHNCDRPDYPITVLDDAGARSYVDGSAFHLYAGDVSAMTEVHDAYPTKNIYFTEQYTPGPGDFAGDMDWAVENLIVGASRNWARTVLLWNLAADASYGPHTIGGCDTCLGGITVDGTTVTRNVGYYIIGHAAKFVRPGWVFMESTDGSNYGLPNVAFGASSGGVGGMAVVVVNMGDSEQVVAIQDSTGIIVTSSIQPGAVETIVW